MNTQQNNTSLEKEILDLLLDAMFKSCSDGRIQKFAFGKPDAGLFDKRFSTEIHYSRRGLQKAALLARKHGPDFLKQLPIGQIEDRLMNFVADNYWYLMDDAFFTTFTGSYKSITSRKTMTSLESAIGQSAIFRAEIFTTLYPIFPLQIDEDFDGTSFFLSAPRSLAAKLPTSVPRSLILPEQFPPVSDHDGRIFRPNSWLGTRAKTLFSSQKIRSAVLGAISLLPHRYQRYTFTGRKLFGGCISFHRNSYDMSFADPETPALSHDIVITSDEKPWLHILDKKFSSQRRLDKKHLRSLEYFYRAWGPSDVARFPTLFMALDAIFGDAGQATQAVISAVIPHMGAQYDYARLKKLLSLRASVIHGGAPEVVESDNYHDYFVMFGENPISDLESIVANCLRGEIFGGRMTEHPHTYADLIKATTGRKI